MILEVRDILENKVAIGHSQAPPPGTTLGYIFSQRDELKAIKRYIVQVKVNDFKVDDWENSELVQTDRVEIDIAPQTFGIATGTILGIIQVGLVYTSILTAVLSVVQFAVGLFNKPKPTKLDTPKDSSTYSWEGLKTSFSPGSPVPVIYGEHGFGGQLLSLAIDVDPRRSDKQLLSMLIGEGCGTITSVNCVKINGITFSSFNNPLPDEAICQAAANRYWAERPDVAADPVAGSSPQAAYEHYINQGQYEGMTWHAELCTNDPLNIAWDWRWGANNQSAIPGFAESRNTFADGREISSISIVYGTQTTHVARVQLQVAALQGLGFFWGGTNPRLGSQTVRYRVEYRQTGSIEYTLIDERAFTAATRSEVWDAPFYNFTFNDGNGCAESANRYWSDYPDVAADPTYNVNYAAAYQHYLDYGIAEGRAWHSELCGGAWEIRLTWLSKDQDERGPAKGDASFHHIWLRNVTEITTDEVQTYSGTALLGVRAVATNQLQGGAPNVTAVIRGRDVRCYFDNVTYITTWTRNPAWCLLDYMTNSVYGMGAFINGPNPITQAAADAYWIARPDVFADPGFNFSPAAAYRHYIEHGRFEGSTWGDYSTIVSQINIQSFVDFATLCDSQVPDGAGGLEAQHCLDLVMDKKKPHLQWVQDILGLYRSSLIYSQGKYKIISDRADLPLRQIFHAGNIVPGTFQMTLGAADPIRPNQINIAYPNRLQDFNMDTIFVQDSASVYGRNEPIKDIDLSLIGVTRESEIIREGHWQLTRRRQNTREITFETGLEALAVELGDKCAVGIVTTNFEMGFGGRVMEGNIFNVVLDREVTVTSGYTYDFYLWHTLSDTPEVRTVATTPGPGNASLVTITVSPTNPFNISPINGDRWVIGITSEDLKQCLVKKIDFDPQTAHHKLVVEEYISADPVTPTLVSTTTFFDLNAPPAQPISAKAQVSYNLQEDGTLMGLTTIDVVPTPLEEGGSIGLVANDFFVVGSTIITPYVFLSGSHCPVRYSLNGDAFRMNTGSAGPLPGAKGNSAALHAITNWTGSDHFAFHQPPFSALPNSGDLYTLLHRGGPFEGFDVYRRALDIENIALYSEELDNAIWLKSNASGITDASTAPSGFARADKIIETSLAAGVSHYMSQSFSVVAGDDITFSCYVKPAERSWIFLQLAANSWGTFSGLAAWFNVASGTTGTYQASGLMSGSLSAIESAAYGFYRCSLSGNVGPHSFIQGFLVLADHNGGNIYVGTSGSGAYFWGAQAERDASLSDYLATSSTPVAVSFSTDYTFVEPVLGTHWEESSEINSRHSMQYKVVPFNTRGSRNYVGDWVLKLDYNGTHPHSGFSLYANIGSINCTVGIGATFQDVASVGLIAVGGNLDVLGTMTIGNNGSGGAGARAIRYGIDWSDVTCPNNWFPITWDNQGKGGGVSSGSTIHATLAGTLPSCAGVTMAFRMKVSDTLATGGVYAEERHLRVLETW